MARPSQLQAARTAPDRASRTSRMAEVMREHEAADGACQMQHLRAAGFTDGEIAAYADGARAILSDRPRPKLSQGQRDGLALVKIAQRIRKCQKRQQEARS
jgi:hypothetical protein